MQFEALFVILMMSTFLAWWLRRRGRADMAREICRQICKRSNLVLLDDTVALRRTFKRNRRTITCYDFGYTRDGSTRRNGSVWLDGMRVDYLAFEEQEGVTLVNP